MELESSQQSPLLPEEIINEEILPRLAVKSLLRFRCVSKSWRSLIDSKRFARIQLQNSTKNTSLAHQRVVMFYFHPAAMWQCSILLLLDKPPELHPLKFDFPTDIPIDSVYSVSPVGCCDGLVCVALMKKYPGRSVELILWNPSTRISKRLPHNTKMARYSSYKHYGFGWDESSGDYKVVTFALDHEGQSTCQIYSLESDAWKKVDVDVPYATLGDCKNGLLLGKGKLHWMSYDYDSGNLKQIDCFDLEREVFEIVEPPPFSDQSSRSWGYLGKIQEFLVVYHWHDNHANDRLVGDVWVMKESWEKLMVVDYTIRPIWTSPSIDSFCMGSGDLIVYNVKFHGWILPYEYVACVESLVSPLG